MQRFDLRYLKDNFYDKMLDIMENSIKDDEVAIIIFEIGDFENIQKSADLVLKTGFTLMNSIKFNEVDWTLVIKKDKLNKDEQ